MYLKGNQLGKKFRRQHSVGGYILDFYCSEKKLIIELDGEIHNSEGAKEYDAIRDKYFKDLDYKVLRFPNNEIEVNIEKVLDKQSALLGRFEGLEPIALKSVRYLTSNQTMPPEAMEAINNLLS